MPVPPARVHLAGWILLLGGFILRYLALNGSSRNAVPASYGLMSPGNEQADGVVRSMIAFVTLAELGLTMAILGAVIVAAWFVANLFYSSPGARLDLSQAEVDAMIAHFRSTAGRGE